MIRDNQRLENKCQYIKAMVKGEFEPKAGEFGFWNPEGVLVYQQRYITSIDSRPKYRTRRSRP